MRIAGRVKQAFRNLGWEVARFRPLRSDQFAAQKHILAGRACRNIYDVGAYHGDVAARYARTFPHASIYAFEPYPPSFEILEKRVGHSPRFHLVNAAVSSASGEGTFHVNKDPSTNSLLPTGHGYAVSTAVTVSKISVPTITLDEFRAEHGLPSPEILKLDIQGNELRALHGAQQTLAEEGPLLIYTEVLFEHLYSDCALFADLAELLKSKGYELFNLYSLNQSPNGRLEFADALFVRAQLIRT
jgi:FkbM family methyltransferase